MSFLMPSKKFIHKKGILFLFFRQKSELVIFEFPESMN